MNALPDITICGEWPDACGNFAPMAEHNKKVWVLEPPAEIMAWRDWFVTSGNDAAWADVEDIEADLGRDD